MVGCLIGTFCSKLKNFTDENGPKIGMGIEWKKYIKKMGSFD